MQLQDGIGSVRMTRDVSDAAAGIRNRNNSEETTMRLSSLTLIVLGVFLSPAVFSGEYPSKEYNVRTVSYAGLDLSTEAGARVAYRRIRSAAKGVCSHLHTLEPGQRRHIWETCVNDATARAVVDVGVPGLTAYATARIGALAKVSSVASND
jgi:UrcA family protein